MGMMRFHHDFVRPEIMRRWRPVVIEIGVEQGLHTRAIWKACIRRLGRVIAVDPCPAERITELLMKLPSAELLATTSLEGLPELVRRGVRADVVIVDGDHNYYTVSRELALIDSLLRPTGVVFLHDVGWPYGRRDLYYVPDRIPPEDRHEFARKGMVEGKSALVEIRGTNGHDCNATHEGGPRNGVMTAVEDFVAGSGGKWALEVRNEEHGLGILRRS